MYVIKRRLLNRQPFLPLLDNLTPLLPKIPGILFLLLFRTLFESSSLILWSVYSSILANVPNLSILEGPKKQSKSGGMNAVKGN
jgi:hypothetical protein